MTLWSYGLNVKHFVKTPDLSTLYAAAVSCVLTVNTDYDPERFTV